MTMMMTALWGIKRERQSNKLKRKKLKFLFLFLVKKKTQEKFSIESNSSSKLITERKLKILEEENI
jgi:hypothetical protein